MLKLLTTIFALGSLLAPAIAAAQNSDGDYLEPPYDYSDTEADSEAPGPRVYGYYQDYDPDYAPVPRAVVRLPTLRNGCGRYYYWDGDRCIDARIVPPSPD